MPPIEHKLIEGKLFWRYKGETDWKEYSKEELTNLYLGQLEHSKKLIQQIEKNKKLIGEIEEFLQFRLKELEEPKLTEEQKKRKEAWLASNASSPDWFEATG